MSSLRITDVISLVARLVLGAVFIVASVEKIADPGAFAVSIGNYRILSDGLSMLAATLLPWIELLCGLGLLFGLLVRGSSLLTLCMLVVFTAAIVSGLIRGLDISCGCFTQDPDVAKIGWWKVAENIGLIVLSFIPLLAPGLRFTLAEILSARSPDRQ